MLDIYLQQNAFNLLQSERISPTRKNIYKKSLSDYLVNKTTKCHYIVVLFSFKISERIITRN